MPKLAYDYQVFLWQPYGGISRYIYEIATRVAQTQDFDVQIYALAYVNNYLKQCDPGLVFGFPIKDIPRSPLAIRLIRRAYAEVFKVLMTVQQPAVVHETFFYAKRLVPPKTKVVITVHDMIHEKFQTDFPKMYQDWGGDKGRMLKAECLKKADHIICVSQSAKLDVMEMLGISSDRLSVVYNGGSMLKAGSPQAVKSIPNVPMPYLLFVGQRQWYKNFQGLLQVYAQADHLMKAFHIVCFGGKPFSAEERQLMAELKIPEYKVVHMTGDDDTLIALYQNATALIYPSLYEGFGIPPLV
ncbi:MAG: glycosyltransferase family 1 protein, partial [Thermosynechococcaceae cyanobacterium]